MKKWSYFGRDKMDFKQETGFINEEFSQQGTLWLDIGKGWRRTMFRITGFAKSQKQSCLFPQKVLFFV